MHIHISQRRLRFIQNALVCYQGESTSLSKCGSVHDSCLCFPFSVPFSTHCSQLSVAILYSRSFRYMSLWVIRTSYQTKRRSQIIYRLDGTTVRACTLGVKRTTRYILYKYIYIIQITFPVISHGSTVTVTIHNISIN